MTTHRVNFTLSALLRVDQPMLGRWLEGKPPSSVEIVHDRSCPSRSSMEVTPTSLVPDRNGLSQSTIRGRLPHEGA